MPSSNLLNAQDPGKIPSNNPLDQEPIYKYNPGIELMCNKSVHILPVHNFDTFRTVVKMVGIGSRSKWTGPSLQWYPWDM